VVGKACPLFVALAEEGWVAGEVPRLVAREYLAELKDAGVDTLVLGCTHYPLLKAVIGEVMGPRVALVDSAEATAAAVAARIQQDGSRSLTAPPTHKFFVTDVAERFLAVGERFLGRPIAEAEQVDVPFH
jgi:glutamate racemase